MFTGIFQELPCACNISFRLIENAVLALADFSIKHINDEMRVAQRRFRVIIRKLKRGREQVVVRAYIADSSRILQDADQLHAAVINSRFQLQPPRTERHSHGDGRGCSRQNFDFLFTVHRQHWEIT